MKDIKKHLLLLVMLCLVTSSIHAQEYCMASPNGFGRAATGGTGGTLVTVDNYADLKTALTASYLIKRIIVITKNIDFEEGQMINVTGNKTILGMPGVRLISTTQTSKSGIFALTGNNIIIRNLIFEGQGAYDVDGQDLIQNTGCSNLWVDHCEFYDGVDGNFDNTRNADNVTISWCIFGYKKDPQAGGSGGSNDHRFTNLIAGSASDCPADGNYSITFEYCYWGEGCKDRMPRARNAELHILNCYYNTASSGTTGIGLGGGTNGVTCYVEGSYFKSIGTVYRSYDNSDGGSHTINFVDCIGKSGTNVGTVAKPAYEYTAIAATAVEEAILNTYGAGATLLVDEQGNVWIPKDGGSAIDDTSTPEWTIKQTGNTLEVAGIEVSELVVYSLSGELVSKTCRSGKACIRQLNPGIYILEIKTKTNEILTKKFIKQ